ncbi:3-oxoacyl-[acyl-carrier-protein] synthase II [Thermomonospora echinospora]|uniref:3-oxoacyl-[acyl-carrier-protein] synthase II n=1 Tax=Thermomonospora echinospora TaxID=1992 RepID=A0A1H5VF72_9ACTN|nr:beta-ketoacyl synthase N-terminal-like domain-containing protein [Thermomonospora echinospora]SEF86015.1 3-oxoacyl-[acyl-carrier-protein] synthase II [Thermomonospora echinospora]
MTAAVAPRPLAITSAGVVSAAGLGLAPLGELLAGGRPGHAEPVGEDSSDYPPRAVRSVPGFRLADHIGRKKIRNLDRLTGFGIVATRQALADAGVAADAPDRAGTGVVLATNTGSIGSIAEVAQDALLQDRPYLVNPSRFPNTVINSCAGQIAIWNRLRGMNATLAAGQLSSLYAFRHALVALGQGRAERLVVGGGEELSATLAWGWHGTGVLPEHAPLGEGCAMFTVEDAGRAAGKTVLADVLACETGYYGLRRKLQSRADGLARCITRALQRAGVEPGDVDLVVLGATHHVGLERIEERGIRYALGRVPERLRVADTVGETYSAGGAMQVAGVLAVWARTPADRPRVALVTSVGHDGNAGALLIRGREAGR